MASDKVSANSRNSRPTMPPISRIGMNTAISDRLMETLYMSPAGPIAPIDILYGHRDAVANGKIHMAHKTGFTYSTLQDAFFKAGFKYHVGAARPTSFDLWIVAFKQLMSDEENLKIAMNYLP